MWMQFYADCPPDWLHRLPGTMTVREDSQPVLTDRGYQIHVQTLAATND